MVKVERVGIGIDVITKNVEVTVDIKIARRMLSVAGYHREVPNMSDEKVFKKVLSMMEIYGAKSVIRE